MGCGPQHREFRKKKFYRQCRLGCRPQHREIGTPISIGNASWRGPNTENFKKEILQAMQVGDD
ncbi:hypothetical protein D1F72_08975 [Staphylococcus aureus]|nr:hypothetical protein D1F72_08975 [Staphylococcus aureus]